MLLFLQGDNDHSLLFLRMIDLTEHFIVKQKSIVKHEKVLLQDVTLRDWILKNPLIGKDQ